MTGRQSSMQGKIIEYDPEIKIGFIRGTDALKYHFSIDDCRPGGKPQEGYEVNFQPSGEKATEIEILDVIEDIDIPEPPVLISPFSTGTKKSKRSISLMMILVMIATIGGFLTIVIISEVEKRQLKELQNSYHAQIENIEKMLAHGGCSEAAAEFSRAKETRNELYQQGKYYSLESHDQQAHAIEIAECFTGQNDLANATQMLDIQQNNNVDYLRRASAIYQKAGDKAKAEQANAKADVYYPAK